MKKSKKIILMLSATLVSLCSFSATAFAKPIDKVEKLSQNEIKEITEMNSQVKDLILNNRTDEIDDLGLVKKYREKIENDENFVIKYMNSFDKFNNKKVEKKLKEYDGGISLSTERSSIGIRATFSDTKKTDVVEMDDGSFIVIENELAPVDNPSSLTRANSSGTAATGAAVFGTYKFITKYTLEYALYPNSKEVLETKFQLSSSGISIISTTTAGTSNFWPTVITPSSYIGQASASSIGSIASAVGNYSVTYIAEGNGLLAHNDSIVQTFTLTSKGSTSCGYKLGYDVTYTVWGSVDNSTN